jgi:hypothetical protein
MIPLPSYNQIAELIKKGATIEAQERIMELRGAAIDLQGENLRLTEELRDANATIAKLEEKLDERANLRHEPPVYYREGDNIPFCQVCLERDDKLSHLIVSQGDRGGVFGECKICGKHFTIKASAPTLSETLGFEPRSSRRLDGLL